MMPRQWMTERHLASALLKLVYELDLAWLEDR